MYKQSIMATILTAILLTGCATQNTDYVDPSLKKSGAHFFSESGFTSCAMGAGIGVLACLVADVDNKLACSAIAGASGCIIGMSANYIFDNVRANYANAEQQLDATTELVKEDIAAVSDVKKATENLIERDKKAISDLESQYQDKKESKSILDKKTKEIDANIAYIKEKLQILDNKIKSYDYAKNKYEKESLSESELEKLHKLEDNIAALKAERDSLYALSETYTSQRNRLAQG